MSIPLTWMWVFYYRIKCWKVKSCANRKCKYWEWCEHSEVERERDEINLIKQMLHEWEVVENNLNKEGSEYLFN